MPSVRASVAEASEVGTPVTRSPDFTAEPSAWMKAVAAWPVPRPTTAPGFTSASASRPSAAASWSVIRSSRRVTTIIGFAMSQGEDRYHAERARIEQGHTKYRDKLRAEGKLFVRDRLKLLLDPGTELQEEWLFARSNEADTPADGVVTGVGRVGGRTVCIMANDYTVKAGSWGEKTVLKIVRIQEKAARLRVPMLYLVDAAGGRISEQIKIFPGRFHAGRIFYNEVQLSGVVPQVCILFGPSPAGSAYLPALTDLVIMVDGKASLYVGSPRMVEMAIGEKTTLEDLGGARMHCTVSGCGDVLAVSDEEAIELARRYLGYMPQSFRERPADREAAQPKPGRSIDDIVPYDQRKWFDMYEVIAR